MYVPTGCICSCSSSYLIRYDIRRAIPTQNTAERPKGTAHGALVYCIQIHPLCVHAASHSWSSPSHTHPWSTSHFAYILLVTSSHIHVHLLSMSQFALTVTSTYRACRILCSWLASWLSNGHVHPLSMSHFTRGHLTVTAV